MREPVARARGTVRPNSFTLYQCLAKSAAYQIIDFWPYASSTGGGLPGTAFQSTSSVTSGTLATNVGKYNLNNITLKLAVDGRAITVALATQNSFVDVGGQESINATLNIMKTINWACYWGNATLYPNQFNGIAVTIPTINIFDAYQFGKANASQGWSSSQAMFNQIYAAAAAITGFQEYGRVTHAFMTPVAAASLQTLVTTLLNNIVTQNTETQGLIVNGDLQGMKTRFGEIQFPVDLFISARDKAALAILEDDGTNNALATLARPATVTAAPATGVAGSAWDATFSSASGIYSYAVATTDTAMSESALTYALGVSGVAVGGAYQVTITGADTTPFVYRVYRSGLGYNPASSGVANPAAFRYVGSIAANGTSAVVFTDLNTLIPGGETVFLLDLDDNDMAVDFRYLLPLSRIELFASNLFMPWAIAMIGSVRVRIPKFNGLIRNFITENPAFNPLLPNPLAT